MHRIQFDRPIAAFQLQQEKLARMVTEITKGQLLALRLGRLKDEGKATPAQVSMAKMNERRGRAGDLRARPATILGANGILGEYPVMRHMANLESVYTYEGTHDMHLARGRRGGDGDLRVQRLIPTSTRSAPHKDESER